MITTSDNRTFSLAWEINMNNVSAPDLKKPAMKLIRRAEFARFAGELERKGFARGATADGIYERIFGTTLVKTTNGAIISVIAGPGKWKEIRVGYERNATTGTQLLPDAFPREDHSIEAGQGKIPITVHGSCLYSRQANWLK